MNTGEKRGIKMGFPGGLYLRQLFSADTYVRHINPFSFWRRYKINHLESCRELDTVQYLKNCYQVKWQPTRVFNIKRNTDNTNTLNYALIKQVDSNRIVISQPTIRLKYRGVTYQVRDLTKTNIDYVRIDPSPIPLNSKEQLSNVNSVDFPKKTDS